MPSSDPYPAPPPAPLPNNNHDPYDFIRGTDHQPKRNILSGIGLDPQKHPIMLLIGGGVIAIIVIFMLFSLIGGSDKKATEKLINLAQSQNEIIRVADIGVSKATSQPTQALAITTQLSMQSAQNDIIAILKKSGHKLSQSDLFSQKNSRIDDQLSAAVGNSSFDETFTKIIKDQLIAYENEVQGAYRSSQSSNTKQVLADSYNGAKLLVSN